MSVRFHEHCNASLIILRHNVHIAHMQPIVLPLHDGLYILQVVPAGVLSGWSLTAVVVVSLQAAHGTEHNWHWSSWAT